MIHKLLFRLIRGVLLPIEEQRAVYSLPVSGVQLNAMLSQQDLQSPVDLFHFEVCDATQFVRSFPPIDGCIQTASLLIWNDHRAIEWITEPQQIRVPAPTGDEFLQREQKFLSSKPLRACSSVV